MKRAGVPRGGTPATDRKPERIVEGTVIALMAGGAAGIAEDTNKVRLYEKKENYSRTANERRRRPPVATMDFLWTTCAMSKMNRAFLVAGALAVALLWLPASAYAQNIPPVASAGPDQTLEATSTAGALVTLDGSGSSDADLNPLTYTWSEEATVLAGPTASATSDVTFAVGIHTVTLLADDGNGGTDTDSVLITIEDTVAPEIQSVTADPDTLWPPNHKMVLVAVDAIVTDLADAEPTWRITGVNMEDLDRSAVAGAAAAKGKKEKPPKPSKDIKWVIPGSNDPHHVWLRAERLGDSGGRVYTITIEASDASGNTATDTVDVTVPHDKRKK